MNKIRAWFIKWKERIIDGSWKSIIYPILKNIKTYLLRQARIFYLVGKGYTKDAIPIKAAALTYYTVLSVVPLLALAFGIAKGFGLQDTMRAEIIKQFHNQQQVMLWVLDIANNALLSTSGGVLAGIGVIMLFYTVTNLFTYIEKIFNSIWKVDQNRPWYRKITDYMTIIIFFPLLFFASSSATVIANTTLNDMLAKYQILEGLHPLITFIVKLLPFLLMFIVATTTFLVMPNTKVKYRFAMSAGAITAVALQLIQVLYIQSQMGISKLNTLYGSFAAIPLLMIWIQMSWMIVLVGALMAYYFQNITRHEFEFDVQNVSPKQKKRISLLIMHLLVKDFIAGNNPRTPQEVSSILSVPIRSVRDSLTNLHEAALVTEIYDERVDNFRYQPALDINRLTLAFVLERLDNVGASHKSVVHHSDYRKIDAALASFESLVGKSESNLLLRDI
ncbi:MAG TPA: YihY/virulence factor BrkB family protein [Bacteroidales bacterium]|nr:YihY/virulence factor BrkB family protein [Bacteroidales bacterium]